MGWAEGSSRENGYNRWVTFHQIGRGSASCETALLALGAGGAEGRLPLRYLAGLVGTL